MLADKLGRKIFGIRHDVIDAGVRAPWEMADGPGALFLVITEMHHYGDPWADTSEYHNLLHQRWHEWAESLKDVFGQPVYFESINCAVAALYPVGDFTWE